MSTSSKINKRNNLTVRLDDFTLEELTEASEDLKMSKAEIIRLALRDELKQLRSYKAQQISKENQLEILDSMKQLTNEINRLWRESNAANRNINQIAKALNSHHETSDIAILKVVSQARRVNTSLEQELLELKMEVKNLCLLLE